MHGTGEAYVRATNASCAGCHSGGAFSAMVADGLAPNQVESGDPEPTRQDCRACHQIHTSYTNEDWALETTEAVSLYAFEGATFDGGKGNLCVNCHQPRTAFPEATDGFVKVDSIHWGPHHGPQSAMLLGIGGAGEVEGQPASHATAVENTCVSCHLANHAFEPSLTACQECHSGAENFDINGLQTGVEEKLAQLETALKAKGMLDDAGEPVVGDYPEAEAAALWNYIYIKFEDKSMGVHNPLYVKSLLDASLTAIQ